MTCFAVSGRGQLTQITQGQTTTDFAYDALGRRFSRTAGGTTTEFVYDAGGMALEKQGGSYTQAYTQANGLLRRSSEYPLFDGHGSERTVTNSSQTVTGSVNFEAFGQVAGSTGSSANPTMYAGDWGYRNDGDAGLMHVGARYYDAQVGRFITRDTVLSEHPYLYCEHEPVGFVDPSGHVRQTLQWYVNFVQSVVARDWDGITLLLDIVLPGGLPPEVERALQLPPIPKRLRVNLITIGPARGHLDALVNHLRKAIKDHEVGNHPKHHLDEINHLLKDAYRDMMR